MKNNKMKTLIILSVSLAHSLVITSARAEDPKPPRTYLNFETTLKNQGAALESVLKNDLNRIKKGMISRVREFNVEDYRRAVEGLETKLDRAVGEYRKELKDLTNDAVLIPLVQELFEISESRNIRGSEELSTEGLTEAEAQAVRTQQASMEKKNKEALVAKLLPLLSQRLSEMKQLKLQADLKLYRAMELPLFKTVMTTKGATPKYTLFKLDEDNGFNQELKTKKLNELEDRVRSDIWKNIKQNCQYRTCAVNLLSDYERLFATLEKITTMPIDFEMPHYDSLQQLEKMSRPVMDGIWFGATQNRLADRAQFPLETLPSKKL